MYRVPSGHNWSPSAELRKTMPGSFGWPWGSSDHRWSSFNEFTSLRPVRPPFIDVKSFHSQSQNNCQHSKVSKLIRKEERKQPCELEMTTCWNWSYWNSGKPAPSRTHLQKEPVTYKRYKRSARQLTRTDQTMMAGPKNASQPDSYSTDSSCTARS